MTADPIQAKPWQWQKRAPRPSAWRKVRTLALDYGEPITRLAQIAGAFVPVPGLDRALDKAGELSARFGADLNIAALDGPDALRAIDGVPPPVAAKTGDGPVFFDGVEATFSLAHNGHGKEQILLERIDLCPIGFVGGRDPYFAYDRDGEAIIGAGFIEPMRFHVELSARGPRPARRQLRGADGTETLLVAAGDNFLNTEPAGFYAFAADDKPVVVKVMLTALDAGYYETCLRFFYRVAARELRQHTTDPIRLYTAGA
jgi:hypothetical protein